MLCYVSDYNPSGLTLKSSKVEEKVESNMNTGRKGDTSKGVMGEEYYEYQ